MKSSLLLLAVVFGSCLLLAKSLQAQKPEPLELRLDVEMKGAEQLAVDQRSSKFSLEIKPNDIDWEEYRLVDVTLFVNCEEIPENFVIITQDKTLYKSPEESWKELAGPFSIQSPAPGRAAMMVSFEVRTGYFAAVALAEKAGEPFTANNESLVLNESARDGRALISMKAKVTVERRGFGDSKERQETREIPSNSMQPLEFEVGYEDRDRPF
jgi:hypothetical protein